MSHLSLRFLGAFQVALDDKPLTDFESDKVRALLVYLAMERDRPHRRDTLANLLWSDWPERSARTNLRNALSNLRSAIRDREITPPFLIINRESLQFNPASDFSLDVADFSALAAREDLDALEAAVNIYRGGFLEGFSIKDSAPFEDWHLLTRERLQRHVGVVLERLATQYEGKGDFTAASHFARQLVELEPWQEEAHQSLMRLLALCGQRSAALAQYETCRRLLVSELGVDPSLQTVHLYEQIRDGELLAPVPTVENQAPAPGQPPFKGLQYFDTSDADIFFGREQLVARLLDRLDSQGGERFLAVVGSSGSGKSSLVRAGLIPAIQRGSGRKADGSRPLGSERWQVHVFSPGPHPLESLAVSLTGDGDTLSTTADLLDALKRDPRSLHLHCRRTLPQSSDQLVLVVDQFEELFTQCRNQDERQLFVDNLMTAVEARGPAIIIITLRADFYGHCGEFSALREALETRQIYIGPMSESELRSAVVEPARQGDWSFEPGLVDLLLYDVGTEPGALPLLSHALLETWQRRRGHMMTLSGYNESGGVRGAIAATADRVLSSLAPGERAIARNIFIRLTELGASTQETRRRASLEELMQRPGDAVAMEAVLSILVDARLVIASEDSVEVAHEALIREWPTLREWLEEDAEGLRIHRHLTDTAQEWQRLNRQSDELYRGARLATAQEWATDHPDNLSALEQEFLACSQEAVDREEREREAQRQRELQAAHKAANAERQRAAVQARAARRLRVGSIALVGLTIIAFLLAVYALRARSTAQREASLNHSLVLAGQAVEADEAGEVDRALALGLAAVDIDDPPIDAVRQLANVADGMGTRFVLVGHNGPVRAGSFSPDGQQVVTGGCSHPLSDGVCATGEFIQWSLVDGAETARWTGHDGWVSAVAWYPFSDRILSGGDDGTLILWDINDRVKLAQWDAHQGRIQAIAISPDGALAASAGDDGTIAVLDMTQRRIVHRLEGPLAEVKALTFNPSGQQLLSGSEDGSMHLWDATNGELIRTFYGHQSAVNGLAYTLDGSSILSGSNDLSLRLWDPMTGDQLQVRESGDRTGGLALSPDGRTVIHYVGHIIYTWDLQEWNATHRKLTGHEGEILDLEISADGRLALSTSVDGTVRIWNLLGASTIHKTPLGFSSTAVAVLPESGRLALGGWQGGVQILETETWQPVLNLTGVTGIIAPGAVSASADGRWIAAGSGDYDGDTNAGSLIVWNVSTGEIHCELTGHNNRLRSVAFSPDSRHLLAGTQGNEDQSLILWDVRNCSLIHRFATEQDTTGIDFSTDGHYAVTASVDSMGLSLWDVESGLLVRDYTNPSSIYLDAAFGPNDETVLGAALDGTIVEWDRETGVEMRRYFGHDGGVWSVQLSPDENYLVSSDDAGQVILWDWASGAEIRRHTAHAGLVFQATFSSDGHTVYSASSDTALAAWQVSDPSLSALQAWIEENRYVRELTCEERVQYGVEPLCK